jgi:hypothetical protein
MGFVVAQVAQFWEPKQPFRLMGSASHLLMHSGSGGSPDRVTDLETN